jgi:hypothetical protein
MIKNEKQICMNCHGDFLNKEIYWVTKKEFYQVLHCINCIEKKGFEEYEPYMKPRKSKTKEEKSDIKKKK